MEYNTSLAHLIIPEYGRNIQRMVDFAMTEKDRNQRNKIAMTIIDVMGQLNPHLRDITDFKHKLWDHLFIISNFKLDVDSPYPMPTAANFKTKPDRIKIPSQRIKYKHYGKTVEEIIKKAVEFPEGPEKDELTIRIANLLKCNYLNWNRDTVNDEVILKHLDELSHGDLKLKDETKLRGTYSFVIRPETKREQFTRRSNDGGGGGSRKSGGGGRRDGGGGRRDGGGGRRDDSRYKKRY